MDFPFSCAYDRGKFLKYSVMPPGIEGNKKFECCGVDNYADFYNRQVWPPKSVKGLAVDLETPVICCKGNSSDYACATKGTANTDNNNMETVS
ncbi:tetraspanin [Plakobranchus ocellatus]|uniref:Tetraspanin n=1 Tax=Plakobranchus ocellatus TaxID=259542 RepID=A0AAV4BVU8_9GAST|nr:tetraspanin [Plakobranchus ocellatus]